MTNYPGSLDDTSDLKNDADDATVTATTHPEAHNNVADAILAIETVVGINPNGAYDTVAAALLNAVFKTPTGNQVIQPTADIVSLIVKSGSNLYVSNLFEGRNASDVIKAFLDKDFIFSAQGLKIAGTALASTHLSDSAALARLASPTLSGAPTAPTPAPGDNTTKIATTAFVTTAIAGFAPLASPTFTGTPAAPTPSGGDNTTKLATTAFVNTAIAAIPPPIVIVTSSAGLPGSPSNGQMARVRCGSTPFSFVTLIYDSTYGHWISDELPLGGVAPGVGGASTSDSIATQGVGYGAAFSGISWGPAAAGLTLQLKWSGYVNGSGNHFLTYAGIYLQFLKSGGQSTSAMSELSGYQDAGNTYLSSGFANVSNPGAYDMLNVGVYYRSDAGGNGGVSNAAVVGRWVV